MNWKPWIHSAAAFLASVVVTAAEQWLHNGKPLPSTPDQWHEFLGVLLTVAGSAIAALLKQSPIQPPALTPAPPKENQ